MRTFTAYAPTGSLILGTLEQLTGRAEIETGSYYYRADGTIDFEYNGGTKLFYDDQTTILRNGKRLFLDENGEEWTEDQLVLKTDDTAQRVG